MDSLGCLCTFLLLKYLDCTFLSTHLIDGTGEIGNSSILQLEDESLNPESLSNYFILPRLNMESVYQYHIWV